MSLNEPKRRSRVYLKLVPPAVVLEVPPAGPEDGPPVLGLEGPEGPVQRDLEAGGDGVAAVEDAAADLQYGGAGQLPATRRRVTLPAAGLITAAAQAQVPQSCNNHSINLSVSTHIYNSKYE